MRKKSQPDGQGAVRRLQRMLATSAILPGTITQTSPVADPHNIAAASKFSLNNTARIVIGQITDATPIGNVYRVQCENGKQPILATYGGRTSANIFGAIEVTTLQPGTLVSVIYHEQLQFGQIISVVPPPSTSANLANHSILHGATRSRADAAHQWPYQLNTSKYIPSFTAGRPFDASLVGEAGWTTETGMQIFIDPFMVLLGGGESCQLAFFYHDMLCRLAAYQFQHWTAVVERESLNDEDELQDWTGYAMYPWEQLGLAARADPSRIRTAAEWQLQEPWYGKSEPVDSYMLPWHREREFHGYLGQGGKRCVIGPPVEFTDNGDKGSNTEPDTTPGERTQHTSYEGGTGVVAAKHPGLADIFITADGRICMQSAKGLLFRKRAAIMTPVRTRRPDDPLGDTSQDYKSSGTLGTGPAHKITGDLKTTQHAGHQSAAAMLDMQAYIFNYAGVHPFVYHQKDFKVYEESEASWVDGVSAAVPAFNKLASEAYLSPENYKKIWKIDHRYGEQTFYTLSSGIEMQADGSITISDGYGAMIKLCGGSIELSAPGDICCRAGRTVTSWGGFDVILRAKNSVDITTTDSDIRLKAEKNLLMLGGNSGQGGVLVESKGSGSFQLDGAGEQATWSGLVLRSSSQLVGWAGDIFLRTGDPDGTLPNGNIVLDAGRGVGAVVTYAGAAHCFVNSGSFWYFDTNAEQVTGAGASLTASGAAIAGSLYLAGALAVDGAGLFSGAVASAQAIAAVSSPYVAPLEGQALQQVLDTTSEASRLTQEVIPQQTGQPLMDQVLVPSFYVAGKPGDSTVIAKGTFSLRSRTDYGTLNYELWEDHWQQLARLTDAGSTYWVEKPVMYQGQATYPYPGRENFEESCYIQQDLTIFDAQSGRSKDRGPATALSSEYTTPVCGEPQRQSLSQYLVIK